MKDFNFKPLFDMYAERDAILANNYRASDLVELEKNIHFFHESISNYCSVENCKELYEAYIEGKGSIYVSPSKEKLTKEQIEDLDNTSLMSIKDIFGDDI